MLLLVAINLQSNNNSIENIRFRTDKVILGIDN